MPWTNTVISGRRSFGGANVEIEVSFLSLAYLFEILIE